MAKRIASAEVSIDTYTRDTRMMRAATVVLKSYKIQPQTGPSGSWKKFEVSGGQQPYQIAIDADWKARPTCTCPDASQRALTGNAGFCKHIIAVLLKNEDLSYQLLDLFL